MNKKIIDTLYQQLNSYRNDKSKKWKGIALQKAISTIKRCDFEIVASNQVSNLPHIGKGMLKRIDEILKTGTLGDLQLSPQYDTNLIEIFKGITGVGDTKAKKWIDEGYKSIETILPVLMISLATCDHPPGLEPISNKLLLLFINLYFLFNSINLKADLAL